MIKRFFTNIEDPMRWMKILLVVLVAAVAIGGPAQAQIGCADLTKSAKDSVMAMGFTGRPGDTVLLPILMKNDSICVGFQILLRYDTSKLTPIFLRDSVCDSVDAFDQCVRYAVDTTFVDHLVAGRLVELDSTDGPFGGFIYDTVTNFNINLFEQRRNVLAMNFLPTLNKLDSVAGGRGVIAFVKFRMRPGLPHLSTGSSTFYEANICVDTGIPPVTVCYDGCNETQIVLAEILPGSTETQTIQVYPSTRSFSFQVDTNSVPDPTITFGANPTQISAGGSSLLTWTATNADSVVISANQSLSGFPLKSTTLISSVQVSPTVTTVFTAKAFKGSSKSDTKTATVTVGTPPTCNLIFSYVPSTQAYTINQGETVAFQVTNTGISGQTITLTASSLPNNATFAPSNPVIGTTSATGNFSFTPDFNQKGSFQITFNATNGTCNATPSTVLIVVNELEKDRLFSTSAAKQKPVGGLRGTGGIKFPINLISAKTVYGISFDMDFPFNYLLVDSFTVTGRIPDYAVYDNLGEFPGTVRVATFGLINDSVKTDTSTAILYAYMTLDSNAVPWTDYPINMRNGRESVNPNPNFPSLELQTDSGIVQCDNPGDVNLDKIIDVADFVNIVSSIIQTFTLNNRQFRAADLIVNDSVNVFDLVADINLFYNRPINPAPPVPPAPASVALNYSDIPMGGSEMVVVTSELPQEVAAVQMDVGYDPNAVTMGIPQVTVDNANYVLQYKDNGAGKLRVLLYATNPGKTAELMQAGAANLVNIPVYAKTNITAGDKNKLRLTQALLSTSNAASITVTGTDAPLPTGFALSQNYPNPFNPTTVIEYSIGAFEDGSARKRIQLGVYNVLGQLVRTLYDGERSPGNYQEEWDATNTTGQRVSSGVYLYRLQVGAEKQTKKMLLLK